MPSRKEKAIHCPGRRMGYIEDDASSLDGIAVRQVSEQYPLPVSNVLGRGVFGEQIVAQLRPLVQLDAAYGLRDTTDVQTFTATGGSAVVTDRMFTCTTGTSVGGYGVVRSKRILRYRPGFGARFRFTAKFSTPAALSLQWAGAFSAVDYAGFGYNGTSFGVTRRIPGNIELQQLTVTAGTGAGATVTITLNGVAFPFAVSGSLSTSALAKAIAAESFTGWLTEAVESSVFFYAATPAAFAGAFSYGTTGTDAASFAQVQVGAANDNDTGHVAQADWDRQPFDGFDPADLNIYEVLIGYLGAANMTFRVYDPGTGTFSTVHTISFADQGSTVPNLNDPSLRAGYLAASLGSTTALTVQGASVMAASEGLGVTTRNPFAESHTQTAVTTEVNVLSIRNAAIFNGYVNRQEILPALVTAAIDGSKPGEIRVYVGGEVTGGSWTYVSDGVSTAHYDTTKGAVTGGRIVAAFAIPGGGSSSQNLKSLDVHLSPNETLNITALVSGGAGADVSAALTWQED